MSYIPQWNNISSLEYRNEIAARQNDERCIYTHTINEIHNYCEQHHLMKGNESCILGPKEALRLFGKHLGYCGSI